MIMPKNAVIISQIINHPLNGVYSSNKKSHEFFREAEKVNVSPNEQAKKSFIISRQLARRIKISLGLIYFFSLIYFLVKLFT
jgi:hypothetical protein